MNVEEKIGNLVDILWDDGKTIRQFHNATKRLISSVLDEIEKPLKLSIEEYKGMGDYECEACANVMDGVLEEINTKRKEMGL